MNPLRWPRWVLLLGLGILSLVPYAYAVQLQDLRKHTVEFEYAFFAAFALYLVAVVAVVRGFGTFSETPVLTGAGRGPTAARARSRRTLAVIFGLAVLFRALLLFTPPTLSDDVYRYVWDGRVQAHGLGPYAYAPAAAAGEVRGLRDNVIWPLINRSNVVTVYPGGAELAFAALWRIWPDNVRWFQLAMAAGDLAAGLLLVRLLQALGRPAEWALVYLWSPLVIFETAHSAHVDGLVFPFLVAAWWARVRGREGWTGLFLGAATALKLYPIVLLPMLWHPRSPREDRWRRSLWLMPVACLGVVALAYVPYLSEGTRVLGYLPGYLDEYFNMGLSGLVIRAAEWWGQGPLQASHTANDLLIVALGLAGLVALLRPPANAEEAVRRCVVPIALFTLLTRNLWPWYLLWLIPLTALFVRPGPFGLRLDAWTGWLLFSGLVALSYTFFIQFKPVAWVPLAEFGPLYALLTLPYLRAAWGWRPRAMEAPIAQEVKG